MSQAATPSLALNHGGGSIPQVGLGTWQAPHGEVGNAVKTAIQNGYRHLDCASCYLNEDEIGDTLEDVFRQGTVSREELFITSKLNNPYHHKEHVRPHLEKTLLDLKLDYVDLYLMHWPVAFAYEPYDASRRGFDESYDPINCTHSQAVMNGQSKIDSTVSIRETWQAMEELVDAGLAKAIGVSNFPAILIHDLLTYARIKPAVNQVELHPYLQQPSLVRYCASLGIVVEAYSPLGAGAFKRDDEPTVLQDPILKEIAAKRGKTVAQVALRWAIQRGTVVIPKSVKEHRIRENLDVSGWALHEEDMQAIARIDLNHHYLRPRDWYGIPIFSA